MLNPLQLAALFAAYLVCCASQISSVEFVEPPTTILGPTAIGQEFPEPLFHFDFDNRLNDRLRGSVLEAQDSFYNSRPIVEATNPQFDGSALVVDGKAMKESYVVRTPSLEFDKFTVVSRCRPFRSCTGELNIVTGGYWMRWLTIFRNDSGVLCVAFNNERLVKEIPVTIESGKWYSLVCSVDMKNKIVSTSVNGKAHEFKLPMDFELTLHKPEWRKKQYHVKEKHFMFDNCGNGRDCQAYVDEFGVYNGLVTPQIAESCLALALAASLITGSNRTLARKKNKSSNNVVERLVLENLNGAGLPATDRAFFEYLEELPSKEQLSQRIRELIKQLGAPEFQKRNSAMFRLRLIGLPALAQLNAIENSLGPEVAYRTRILVEEMTDGNFVSLSVLESLLSHDKQPRDNLAPYLFFSLEAANRDLVRLRICELLLVTTDSTNRVVVQQALKNQDKWVRFAAILLLERANESPEFNEGLNQYLTDKDELIRLAAAYLVSRQSSKSSPDPLQEYFESKDWKIRFLSNCLSHHETQTKGQQGSEKATVR